MDISVPVQIATAVHKYWSVYKDSDSWINLHEQLPASPRYNWLDENTNFKSFKLSVCGVYSCKHDTDKYTRIQPRLEYTRI